MIGSDGLDFTAAEAIPHSGLVFLVAQWRRHHILCAFEIRLLRVRFIEHQILNQCLDGDVHPPMPRGERFAQGFVTAQVHDVNLRAG
jgi:hypothetical protein